uniref:hypothetical protein n=1 Tax=uncultured Tateyamaria sp. TaxID=455651 RepID=UPI002619588B
VVSAEQCAQNDLGLSCSFSELATGENSSITLSLNSTDDMADLVFHASVEADQEDRDGTNDVANISVTVVDADLESQVEPEPEPDAEPESESGSEPTTNGSGGGALSILWLLLALAYRLRYWHLPRPQS